MAKSGSRKNYVAKSKFHPGGEKGKLHRELGISEDKKIPLSRLNAATHSRNPEIKRDAIRAKTMAGWHHSKKHVIEKIYDHPGSKSHGR
jgi:hypothetical protein